MMRWLFALLLALASGAAWAHKPSDSYLVLKVDGAKLGGHWDIALRDLDFAIGLDGNGDGQLTWDEIEARHAAIAAYAMARFDVRSEAGPCTVTAGEQLVDHHTDGAYTVIALAGHCPAAARSLTLHYTLFADIDPLHKGLLRIEHGGHARNAIFGVDAPRQTIALDGGAGRFDTFLTYLKDGIWHIWIGFDHMLFLASLLLPAVLVWRDGAWQPGPGLRTALTDTLKVVSAFTLAHSLTLSAAALGLVALPSRWVESAIAASVVLAALNNIVPVVKGGRWMAAFGFGLIHGFGFASVLAGLGLPRGELALALFGFNAGVEVGQAVLVALFVPLAFALRASWFYRRVAMTGGSAITAALAGVWLVERAFDIRF